MSPALLVAASPLNRATSRAKWPMCYQGVLPGSGNGAPEADPVKAAAASNGGATEHEDNESVDLSGTPLDPGFSDPASACINKAGWIAFVLNHPRMNAAHLILAMESRQEGCAWPEDARPRCRTT